jgi:chromosome segregation ATPase
MSTHITIACPSCHHELRARREYVGRTVSCKHCSHTFTIRAPDDRVLHVEPEAHAGTTSTNGREEALAGERDRLRSELAEVRSLLARSGVAGEPAEHEQVRLERDRLRDEAEAARRELESVRTERDRLQEENARLASGRGAEDTTTDSKKERRDEARAAAEALAALSAKHEAERSRWDAERGALEKRAESQLAAARESARRELDESRRQFEAERSSFGRELEELRSKADALGQECVASVERIESLLQERDRLASDHGAAQTRLERVESAHQVELARHIEEHATERERLAAEIEELRTSRDDAEQARQSERDQFNEQLEHHRVLTDTAAQRGDELAGEVREIRGEYERLQQEHEEALAALRREYDAARAGLQHQIAELQEKLRNTTAQVEQLQVGFQASADARHVLDSELDEARRQIAAVQQELLESQNAGNQIRSLLKHIGIHLP